MLGRAPADGPQALPIRVDRSLSQMYRWPGASHPGCDPAVPCDLSGLRHVVGAVGVVPAQPWWCPGPGRGLRSLQPPHHHRACGPSLALGRGAPHRASALARPYVQTTGQHVPAQPLAKEPHPGGARAGCGQSGSPELVRQVSMSAHDPAPLSHVFAPACSVPRRWERC